jgi:tRNA (cytidine32/uridine32-2'-O)-methyltransferase
MTDSFAQVSDKLAIVLVETSHPANIGSAARAMKTMGLSQLRLVKPHDFPSARANWLAAGAEDVLRNAVVFNSFDEAVADCQLVIGTSARLRGLPWPHVPPLEAAGAIIRHTETTAQCALVFGREASGLSNEELRACHLHTLIPGNAEYSVLNIAQAVQVLCYEVRTQWLLKTEEYRDLALIPDSESKSIRGHMEYPIIPWDEPLSTAEQMSGFLDHFKKSLSDIGFLAPHNEGKIWPRLQRLFQRQRLDQKEVAILRGLCTQLEKMTQKK